MPQTGVARWALGVAVGLFALACAHLRASIGWYVDWHGWLREHGVCIAVRHLDTPLLLLFGSWLGARVATGKGQVLAAIGLRGSWRVGLTFGLLAATPMLLQGWLARTGIERFAKPLLRPGRGPRCARQRRGDHRGERAAVARRAALTGGAWAGDQREAERGCMGRRGLTSCWAWHRRAVGEETPVPRHACGPHGDCITPAMNTLLPAASALFLLAASAAAQTWSYPLDPRATYLRTNQDSPLPPLVLDLPALGIAPGQWLRLESTGAFRYINGGLDDYRSLVAVFSNSAQLLATSVQQRVPGAIAAGPAFVSGGTYYGNLPIDVPQDFFVSRQTWDDGVLVEVPAGASHLFLGVHDSLFNDNADPNGDFGARVTVVATPSLPGTGEHLTLKSSVGGPAALTPDVHPAPPGLPMLAELHHPVGFLDGALYVLVADTMATGGPAPSLLPRLWSVNLFVLQVGVIPNTPGWSTAWSLVAPAGLLGTTLVVQGGALSPLTRNGLYETTNAHRFALQ